MIVGDGGCNEGAKCGEALCKGEELLRFRLGAVTSVDCALDKPRRIGAVIANRAARGASKVLADGSIYCA